MKPLILIIDDDEKLDKLLSTFLSEFGFRVIWSTHPDDGLKKLKKEPVDLVILDYMLPDMNGFEVLKAIRQSNNLPVIMLTAKGATTDKVVGLELGADDYIPKPFEPRELAARIHSALRRSQGQVKIGPVVSYGSLKIDYHQHVVSVNGAIADLTTSEFETLSLLAKNNGKVLSRDEIIDELRGIEWDAFNRSVDITMSRLRAKLGDDPKKPKFIKTVWGSGYMFIGKEDSNGA